MRDKERRGREPLLSRDFLLVCGGTFFAFFSIYLIIPILPQFLQERGYSNLVIGSIMSMILISTLFRPYMGRFSDWRGRRVLMVWGVLLLSVSNFLYAPFNSATPLFLVRFLNGLGMAAFHTGAFALVGDLAPPSRRLEGIALFFISVDAAIASAPLIGEAVKDNWGYAPVYVLAGGLALFASLTSLLVSEEKGGRIRESLPASSNQIVIKTTPIQRTILVVLMGYTLTFGSLSTFIVLSAKKAGMDQGELFFTAFAVMLISFRLAVGSRADRWPRRQLILISGIITLVGLAFIAFSRQLFPLILGSLIYALGFAYVPTTLSALLLDNSPEGSWGIMLGLFFAIFDLGVLAGSVVMSPIADASGYPGMYMAGAALACVSLIYFFLRTQPVP